MFDIPGGLENTTIEPIYTVKAKPRSIWFLGHSQANIFVKFSKLQWLLNRETCTHMHQKYLAHIFCTFYNLLVAVGRERFKIFLLLFVQNITFLALLL